MAFGKKTDRAGLQAVQKLGKQQCHKIPSLSSFCGVGVCCGHPMDAAVLPAGGIHPMSAGSDAGLPAPDRLDISICDVRFCFLI